MRCLSVPLSSYDRRTIRGLASTHRRVVVDFGNVLTITGSGLDMIQDCVDLVESEGAVVVFAQCSKQIRSLLRIVRTMKTIPIFSSVRESLTFFTSPPKAVGHHAG